MVVNDGSTDETDRVLEGLCGAFPTVRTMGFRRNRGKSAALELGLGEVVGEVVVLMDADGQDDPRAIPDLLTAIESGLDLVTGRRANRQDRLIKRVTSRLYNATTARLTGIPGRDFNSGLKAMRSDVAADLDMYGELHRYIPVLAHWSGYRVGEIDVEHRERLHGKTKFGGSRFARGLLDLLTVKFLTTYMNRPFHLFGGAGMIVGTIGGSILTWLFVLRIQGETIGTRPALVAGVLLVITGMQLASLGLLAELMVLLARRRAKTPANNRSENLGG